MQIKKADTFTANIYVGLREGYTEHLHTIEEVREICQAYVNDVGLCVTITQTEFVYVDGSEPGVVIGLINYPRFPSENETIRSHAEALSAIFIEKFKQQKISIVYGDHTIMMQQ